MPQHLTREEYRALREDAQTFARTARPGQTYFVLDRLTVTAIQFKDKPLIGLMYGSFSPEKLYEHAGPIYSDRSQAEAARAALIDCGLHAAGRAS